MMGTSFFRLAKLDAHSSGVTFLWLGGTVPSESSGAPERHYLQCQMGKLLACARDNPTHVSQMCMAVADFNCFVLFLVLMVPHTKQVTVLFSWDEPMLP